MLQHVDHHLMHALPKTKHLRFKGLFPWDSTTLQPAPPMEQRLAQGPLPLGFSHLAACSSHWDSATLQPAPPMEQRLAQGPLILGLGHLAACSSYGATLRLRASPTGTRPSCSLLLRWNNASLKGLSHWDSATLQLAPLMEQRFAQEPLPLGLSHPTARSSYGSTLRSKASPTRTRPPYSSLLLWSNTSLTGLSHWDSAT
ncbi:hypothetical protein Adt_34984 [Abeliophyllum distichum]|uniref:Uncharacterized protein n=1 Tax=Abeliophyllum distichum TaxID=126358 RepID=A0ABD1QF88_9LAMI